MTEANDPAATEPAATEPAGTRSGSGLSSVRNAARVLKEFSRGTSELGVTELSRRLGISKSTAHRLLVTLTEERLLEQDPYTGTYRLGLAMYELGASAAGHADLHHASVPVIEQLAASTRETIQVAVLDGREVVYVERRDSPQALRIFGRIGHRNDAYCTSTGKVLLAFLPTEQCEATLDGWVLTPRTEHTITSIPRLRRELEIVRTRGWADNVNEVEIGVASVAAPIRNASGEVVAAVSVAGPLQRLTPDSLKRYARAAVEGGLAISRRLGYRDTPMGRSGA